MINIIPWSFLVKVPLHWAWLCCWGMLDRPPPLPSVMYEAHAIGGWGRGSVPRREAQCLNGEDEKWLRMNLWILPWFELRKSVANLAQASSWASGQRTCHWGDSPSGQWALRPPPPPPRWFSAGLGPGCKTQRMLFHRQGSVTRSKRNVSSLTVWKY